MRTSASNANGLNVPRTIVLACRPPPFEFGTLDPASRGDGRVRLNRCLGRFNDRARARLGAVRLEWVDDGHRTWVALWALIAWVRSELAGIVLVRRLVTTSHFGDVLPGANTPSQIEPLEA